MRDDMAGGRGGRAAVTVQSSPKSGGVSAKEIVRGNEVNGFLTSVFFCTFYSSKNPEKSSFHPHIIQQSFCNIDSDKKCFKNQNVCQHIRKISENTV